MARSKRPARDETPGRVLIAFRLPAELIAALRAHAKRTGETMTDVVERGARTVLGKTRAK